MLTWEPLFQSILKNLAFKSSETFMCTVESNLSPVLGEFAPHFPVKYCHNYKVIRHQKNNVVKIQLWTIGEYTAYLWNLIMKKTQASLTLKESHTWPQSFPPNWTYGIGGSYTNLSLIPNDLSKFTTGNIHHVIRQSLMFMRLHDIIKKI